MASEPRVADSLADYLADTDGLAVPPLLEIEEAARRIASLYEESGGTGATFSLRFGDMSGQSLYSVSLWPERARKFTGSAVKVRILQVFIRENLDLLNDARGGIGLWYNGAEDTTYLDIVATLPSRQNAIALAVTYDQIAIFDLHTLTEIETGGTGNTPAELPPATERLPTMEAQGEEEPS